MEKYGKIEKKGEGTPKQHKLLRKSGRENKEMEGKEREEGGKNTVKTEEKGGGTPNQHQLVRKSGRENKEMEG